MVEIFLKYLDSDKMRGKVDYQTPHMVDKK